MKKASKRCRSKSADRVVTDSNLTVSKEKKTKKAVNRRIDFGAEQSNNNATKAMKMKESGDKSDEASKNTKQGCFR